MNLAAVQPVCNFIHGCPWEKGVLANMAINTTPAPPTEAPSDELDLVARAKAGDGAAFSVLINRYEGKIFRLAMNITQNREDAEDVLQEAFFKAYEHLGQFQGNSEILCTGLCASPSTRR